MRFIRELKSILMSMLRKIYYYFFFQLDNLFKNSLDTYHEWKAWIVIQFVQGVLIMQISNFLTKGEILKTGVIYDALLVSIAIILSWWNYGIFIRKRYWQRYVPEFKSMTRMTKIISNTGIALFFIVFIWFCFFLKVA